MDRHSRVVKILQYGLPALAIGLLIFVFMRDWTNTAEVTDQFSKQDTQFTDNSAEVVSPSINARTSQGDEINLKASTVEKTDQNSNQIVGTDISGDLEVGGSQWQIQSDQGEADTQDQTASFRGRVMALIDGRYNLQSSELLADVVERTFVSNFPIDVKSDRFDLSADSGKMSGELGSRVIELDGNVQGVIRFGKLNDG